MNRRKFLRKTCVALGAVLLAPVLKAEGFAKRNIVLVPKSDLKQTSGVEMLMADKANQQRAYGGFLMTEAEAEQLRKCFLSLSKFR